MTELKSRRLQRKITQKEAAERIGISLRSYIMYEDDESKEGTPKYRFLLQEMDRIILLDESHGILSIKEIKQKCADVFALYHVEFSYLFGSYAKGKLLKKAMSIFWYQPKQRDLRSLK